MNRLAFCRNRRASGFSLTELLVVLVVTAVLLTLSVPGIRHLRGRSEAIRCQQNLRNIGTILIHALNEQGGVATFWYRGNTGLMWNTMLITGRYATRDELRLMSCPGIEYAAPDGSISGRHYGIYFGSPEGRVEKQTAANGLTGQVYRLPIRTNAQPAASPFLVDSATEKGAPTIRCYTGAASQPNAREGAIHLRHQGTANLFFLDGHLEAASPERLRQFATEQVLTEDFQLISIL